MPSPRPLEDCVRRGGAFIDKLRIFVSIGPMSKLRLPVLARHITIRFPWDLILCKHIYLWGFAMTNLEVLE